MKEENILSISSYPGVHPNVTPFDLCSHLWSQCYYSSHFTVREDPVSPGGTLLLPSWGCLRPTPFFQMSTGEKTVPRSWEPGGGEGEQDPSPKVTLHTCCYLNLLVGLGRIRSRRVSWSRKEIPQRKKKARRERRHSTGGHDQGLKIGQLWCPRPHWQNHSPQAANWGGQGGKALWIQLPGPHFPVKCWGVPENLFLCLWWGWGKLDTRFRNGVLGERVCSAVAESRSQGSSSDKLSEKLEISGNIISHNPQKASFYCPIST